jgi:hypothetical protein
VNVLVNLNVHRSSGVRGVQRVLTSSATPKE